MSSPLLFAQGNWTLTIDWSAVLTQFALLSLVAFVALAVPIVLVLILFFRLRLPDAEGGSASGGLAAETRLDPNLGYIYESPPADRDALREITGIGEVLEAKLHEIGVYKFRQIAAWEDDEAAEFGKRLSFGDRVIRDHWREQAARLHVEKFGPGA